MLIGSHIASTIPPYPDLTVGLVPRRSTQIGGLRTVGKTADEAMHLLEQCRRYEDAGACWVEFECVASEALKEISKHTSLITHSIGAGPSADIIFLFMEDICGDNPDPPRHARAFGDLLSIRKQLSEERLRAVTAYKTAVEDGSYPGAGNAIVMPTPELEKLREALDKL
jgi:3-methyl-2-oxobutanoate hydroxymethyltransferase